MDGQGQGQGQRQVQPKALRRKRTLDGQQTRPKAGRGDRERKLLTQPTPLSPLSPRDSNYECDGLEPFPQTITSFTTTTTTTTTTPITTTEDLDYIIQCLKFPDVASQFAKDFDEWSDNPPAFISPGVEKPYSKSSCLPIGRQQVRPTQEEHSD